MDTGGEGGVEQNDGDQRSDLNLSDVLKVLQDADGAFEERPETMAWSPAHAPYVRIVEQPAPKALRFRYECEGRSAGSILGVNSTPERKTYPTIEIGGYTGAVFVVVCCVTCDEPYRPHPHKLVGNDCQNGVHSVRSDITADNRTISFSKLGVQCVRRKDVAEALLQRERAKIDPFRTGYDHRNNPQSINLNAVRLCFHVYLEEGGKYRKTLRPVVSDMVYDKKAMSELSISRISACTASARGGLQLILLCDKVSRDEISVVFEERSAAGGGGEAVVWRDAAVIDHVHKQYAIVCTVPPYRNPLPADDVETYLFLERKTDGACSNKISFKYIPDNEYSAYLIHKKRKRLDTRDIESFERDRPSPPFGQEPQIKLEPRDAGLRSPQQVLSPPNAYYQDYGQQWSVPGGYQYGAGAAAGYGAARLEALSPDAQAHSPHVQAGSPLMHVGSPHMQAPSPHMQVQSPHSMQAPSPHMQAPSPHMQAPSPHMMLSPAHVTHQGLIAPGLMQPMQQQQQQGAVGAVGGEAGNASESLPSLSALLNAGAGGAALALDSGELPAFLDRSDLGLSDSLNRLSTNADFYQ